MPREPRPSPPPERPLPAPCPRVAPAVLLLASLASLAAPGAEEARAAGELAAERPNILFIFTDDHAPHAIGAYGSKISTTPNIDRLAREGMLFSNSFCTNSICGPSRAVILTGKHSHLNGFRTNNDRFDGSQETVAKILRRSGYQTAVIGKWHLVSDPTGFDFWQVLIGQGPYYNPVLKTPEGEVKHTGYTTEIITDITLDWLRAKRDASKPFFLMYQHKAPHREWAPGPKQLALYNGVSIPEPATLFDDWANRTSAAKTQTMTIADHLTDRDLKLVPPPDLTPEQLRVWNAAYEPENEAFRKAKLAGRDLVRWKYQRYIKDYLRCVAAADDGIGQVLAYLDETGLARSTVVIYSSDQGFYLGDHGWYDKRWMYEESLKMPLIVRWPGAVKPGSVSTSLVQNLDYAETFLEIAGAAIPGDMQGRSLVPLLKGEAPADWRRSIYYHYYEFPGPHSVRRHYGVRTARHKLIKYYEIGEWELFDLEKDPDEMRSVHGTPEYAAVQKDLEAELARLQKEYRDDSPEAPLEDPAQAEVRRRAAGAALEEVLRLETPPGTPLKKAPAGLDPSAKPITAGAWCTPESGDGVLIAHGGNALGWSLYLEGGTPRFAVRSEGEVREVQGKEPLPLGARAHVAAVLAPDGELRLFVNGKEAGRAKGHLIARRPADGLSLGDDTGSQVAAYARPTRFRGKLEDLRLYWGVLGQAQLEEWASAR
jgi:arylsulfatase A-like enzyme